MPELPDIVIYLEALDSRLVGRRLEGIRLHSPFLVRTVEPPLHAAHARRVVRLCRLGKRIAVGMEGDLWLVLHLMIAGRLHWKPPGAPLAGIQALAAFDFAPGTLTLTEAGPKKRASLYVVKGEEALASHDPGGLDVFAASEQDFTARLRSENHTLKRALTDPRLFNGIGNAYGDEILHSAGLSPLAQTLSLSDDKAGELFRASRDVLGEWIERLRQQAAGDFPENVTAFRPEMAVHGKFGQPCPRCGAPVQRIRYANNETNYCPGCQTGRRILADRSLSRLLKDDWPRNLDDL